MIYDDLFEFITGNQTLSSVISDRVYAVDLREDATYPCISIRLVDSEHEGSIDASGICVETIRVIAYSTTLSGALDLAAKVKSVLQGYKGSIGETKAMFCKLVSQSDEAFIDNASEERVFLRASDYAIKHRD